MDTPRLSDLSSSLPVAMLPSHSVRFGGFLTGGNAYSFTSSPDRHRRDPIRPDQSLLVEGLHATGVPLESCPLRSPWGPWQRTLLATHQSSKNDVMFFLLRGHLTTSEHKSKKIKSVKAFKTNRKLYVLLEAVPFLRFCECEQASM